MHGHPDSIAPGPLDDDAILKGVAMGIEHEGRFGILEFKQGRYRYTIEKGAARVEPGLRGRNEKVEIQKMLDEYQER
jgi:hypothetical protein